MSVAHDAEGLSADLPAAFGLLVPNAGLHLECALEVLSREGDHLGDDELRDRARVGEGRIEDRDARFGRTEKVHLIGADAETSDHQELMETEVSDRTWSTRRDSWTHLGRSLEHAFCNFGLTPDTNGMVGTNLGYELVLGHGLGRMVDMEALGTEGRDGFLADVFEDEEPEVFVVYGMKDLGLANGKVDGVLAKQHAIVETTGGNRGG